jgi:glycosyltransferase involved in cell wall biosynthesis
MFRKSIQTLFLTLRNYYFSSHRIRRVYAFVKKLSYRIFYPLMPWLHNLMFIKLKKTINHHLLNTDQEGINKYYESSIKRLNLYSLHESRRTGFSPKVSVIVPNYNHSGFLRQRLDSIYQQTYRNFEVILLDDASTDDSTRILTEYAQRYPEITRCCFNKKNSGGVFNQWRLGLKMAQGDLIWIAESDDYCTNNMLEQLINFFANEAVMLAYCKTLFINGLNNEPIWSIEEYLMDLDPGLWRKEFVMSAHHLVNEAWSIKNIIPNVSSAVFRNPGNLKIIDDEEWSQMRICGDWIFYLHVIRGGLVAYSSQATNYFRIHQNNTSVSTYNKDIYYIEHEIVAKQLLSLYRIQENVFRRQKKMLESHWQRCRIGYSEKEFKACYDYERFKHCGSTRKPNILMVTYALSAGGGETFPINLANLLKDAGYGVNVLNCHQEPTEPGIRKMLRPAIPLIELDNIAKLPALVNDMGIELVHSHHAWVDLTCCSLLEDSPNNRSIITMHGMYEMIDPADFSVMIPLLNTRVRKFVYTAKKNLTPFSPNLFNLENFIRIDNALEKKPFHPFPRPQMGIPEEAFVLCLVSRAIPEKGWEETIKAVILARKSVDREIYLLLIGEGPEQERLRPIFQNQFIHFLGFRPDIRNFFSMADIGLLPSRFSGESFPLVLIDCLHSNRPMIATNIGEIPQMLQTDEGPAGTILKLDHGEIPIDEFAEIIASYVNNSKLYREHLGRVPKAAAKFDQATMVQSYEAIYQDLFQEIRQNEKHQVNAL